MEINSIVCGLTDHIDFCSFYNWYEVDDNMSGTRLYSIKEIKKMCAGNTISDELKTYIMNAPRNVVRIIDRWSGEKKEYLSDNLEDEVIYSDFVATEGEQDSEAVLVITSSEEKDTQDIAIREKADVQCVNPYEGLEFESRLDVDSLYIHISEDSKCPVHRTELKSIQVVVKYDQGKKFGVMCNCCKLCKRIYCSQSQMVHIREAILDKNIFCEVFEQ
ncbi:MAG: hypothetical protein K6G88_05870 [Lachnospiraceae bacterium]|nr:hypothetical protein [Lachnospiraceae bacterium]